MLLNYLQENLIFNSSNCNFQFLMHAAHCTKQHDVTYLLCLYFNYSTRQYQYKRDENTDCTSYLPSQQAPSVFPMWIPLSWNYSNTTCLQLSCIQSIQQLLVVSPSNNAHNVREIQYIYQTGT